MNIESFRDRYNFPDLRDRMMKERTRFPQLSVSGVLAMKFADFSAEELKIEEAKIKEKARLYNQQYNKPYYVSPFDREKTAVDYAGVVFGLSLKFTEGAFENGVFDKPGFAREHNEKIMGSVMYVPLYSEPWDVRILSGKQWKGLMELAESKKSLSVLFEKGYELMPNPIQEFVGRQDNLHRIRRWIIPGYKLLEQRLVD